MKLKTSEKQAVTVRKMVSSQCCNYEGGFYLLLNDVCPQELSASGVICKHFVAAVLPDDSELCKQLFGSSVF